MPKVNAYWFQIFYGSKFEIIVSTGPDLQTVVTRMENAQRGRLKYNPKGPRMTRIRAIPEPRTVDAEFKAFIDECLRIESNASTA